MNNRFYILLTSSKKYSKLMPKGGDNISSKKNKSAIYFVLAILTVVGGTVAGSMHKTGLVWDILIYRVIPIVTVIIIAISLIKKFSPKLAVRLKDTDLTVVWIGLVFLSLLTIFISGITAILVHFYTAFYLGLLIKVLFVLLGILWLASAAFSFAVAERMLYDFKTEEQIWWEQLSSPE